MCIDDPPRILETFKWSSLCNRLSDPLPVWFQVIFGVRGFNGAIFFALGDYITVDTRDRRLETYFAREGISLILPKRTVSNLIIDSIQLYSVVYVIGQDADICHIVRDVQSGSKPSQHVFVISVTKERTSYANKSQSHLVRCGIAGE